MAVHGTRVGVTGAPTPLNVDAAGDPVPGQSVILTNKGTVPLDIGGPTVASGAGYELAVGDTLSAELAHDEVVFAIGPDAGPHSIHVLAVGAV